MPHYELCDLNDKRRKVHADTFAMLDTAMHRAGRLGIACTVVLVEAYDRTIRAFAREGRVEWAESCTDCDGGLIAYCGRCFGVGANPENPLPTPRRQKVDGVYYDPVGGASTLPAPGRYGRP